MLGHGSYSQTNRTICPYCRKIHGRANVCIPEISSNLLINSAVAKSKWPSAYSIFSVCLTGLEFIRFFI